MSKKLVLFFLSLFVIAAPFLLSADTATAQSTQQSEFQTLAKIPGTGEGVSSIGEFINILFRIAIGIGSVIGVLMIVIGGFEYLSSDIFQKKATGRERIKNALLGIGLLLSSFLILNTINEDLTDLSFTPLQATSKAVGVNSAGRYVVPKYCLRSSHDHGQIISCYDSESKCRSKIGNTADFRCSQINNIVEFDECEDCVLATEVCQAFNAQPCQTGVDGERACMVSPSLKGPLTLASQTTSKTVTCTEVWPPTVKHKDDCHGDGTCLDFRITEAGVIPAIEDMMKTIQAFENSGGCAVFEIGNSSARNAILKDAESYKDKPGFDYDLFVKRVKTVAGVEPHFSGYTTPTSSSGKTRNHCK